MSDYGDNMKYKWTPESTTLLVSVWTDKQVQKQLEYAQRPQLIWESVARYMTKKGYGVSAKQCRSRMKQVLVCYREAKRAGTRAGVEQYYDSIDKVLKNKKCQRNDATGFDTVDSAVKSPPKDVKTDKNHRLRYNKYGEPAESLLRTEALSPTWHLAYDEDYPDSPESNETVLAQPYRAFSPTRDAATNTLNGPSQLLAKCARRSLPLEEHPIRESRDTQQSLPNNRFGEMLYQNTVQNVQNQIIQENMQQHRNFVHSHSPVERDDVILPQPKQMMNRRQTKGNTIFYSADENVPTKLRVGSSQTRALFTFNDPPSSENTMRMQNQLQQTCVTDNRAVPQEPRRGNFAQNLANNYKFYKDVPETGGLIEQNLRMRARTSRNYSPETAANLNEAFRQSPKDERNRHNFNDPYEEQRITENDVIRAMNATTITNNATFNDDTLSIDFLEGGSPSPSPSDNGAAKSASVNSDKVPNAPLRVKKAQKLERLMLSAITSQTEVVNKILAAQDAMVSRFLDLDRDRQNRLENRFDHLMNVVHATVLNKSSEKDSDSGVIPPPLQEHNLITNLEPPPRPGVIPPKLDLVPPKPCRVPCTVASGNVELVNQKIIETRPGVVGANNPPGAIWCKLGPVSQSPFVKAQQQLGLRIGSNGDARTQSSAERRINREIASRPMDSKTLIFETKRLLEIERQIEEQAENARILARMGQEVATRRKLFAGRGELNAGIILTAAFLDSERQAARADDVLTRENPARRVSPPDMNRQIHDDDEDEELVLLAGQVEQYERLRRLKTHPRTSNEPCDSSTPAKVVKPGPSAPSYNDAEGTREAGPRQTIQQLAELVMKSARWRDAAINERAGGRFAPPNNGSSNNRPSNVVAGNENDERARRANDIRDMRDKRRSYAGAIAERQSNEKALGWLQDRYSYGGGQGVSNNRDNPDRPLWDEAMRSTVALGPHPMGFTTENMKIPQDNVRHEHNPPRNIIGFNPDILLANNNYGRRNVAFADLEAPFDLVEKTGQATYPRQRRQAPQPPQRYNNHDNYDRQYSTLPAMHQNMIDRYVQENRGIGARKPNDEDDDDDDDDKYFDSTMSMHPSRKTSLTSTGTFSGKPANCTIS